MVTLEPVVTAETRIQKRHPCLQITLQGRADLFRCCFAHPGVPDFRMLLEEDFCQLGGVNMLLGHSGKVSA